MTLNEAKNYLLEHGYNLQRSPESLIDDLEDELRKIFNDNKYRLEHKYMDDAYCGQTETLPVLNIINVESPKFGQYILNPIKYRIVLDNNEWRIFFPGVRRISKIIPKTPDSIKQIIDFIIWDMNPKQ